MRRILCAVAAITTLSAALAVSATALAAPPQSAGASSVTRDVPAGFDLFETDPQQTAFNFAAMGGLPAGFFGPGSDPFTGSVNFCGEPVGTFNGKDVGDADTVVQRTGSTVLPGPGSSGTVPIELVTLNLVSCEPISVRSGDATQLWEVDATLSPTHASQGTMTVRQDGERGGTFSAQLPVIPIFTFRGPNGQTVHKDFGSFPTLVPGLLTQITGGVWNRRCEPPALRVPGLNEVFCPGITPNPKPKKKLGVWISPFFQIAWVPAQPRLEHFACYRVQERGKRFNPTRVTVTDQFGTRKQRLKKPRQLCNPAQKNNEPYLEKKVHLKCYAVRDKNFQQRAVVTHDQFGSLRLNVIKPRDVCFPSFKKLIKGSQKPTISGQPNPRLVDRFMCYDVSQQGDFAPIPVAIKDQFGRMNMTVRGAVILCNPAKVGRTDSYHPVQHLVCYRVVGSTGQSAFHQQLVQTSNEFGREALKVSKPKTLCVPANKIAVP